MVSSSVLLKSGFSDALPFLYVGVQINGSPVLIGVLSCPEKSSLSVVSSPDWLLHGLFFCLFFMRSRFRVSEQPDLKVSFFSLTYLL
jgi:hypothetical protein